MSNHIHVEDTSFVEAFDNMFRRNADCRNEECSATFDDNINQLIELTFGIVIARNVKLVDNFVMGNQLLS